MEEDILWITCHIFGSTCVFKPVGLTPHDML